MEKAQASHPVLVVTANLQEVDALFDQEHSDSGKVQLFVPPVDRSAEAQGDLFDIDPNFLIWLRTALDSTPPLHDVFADSNALTIKKLDAYIAECRIKEPRIADALRSVVNGCVRLVLLVCTGGGSVGAAARFADICDGVREKGGEVHSFGKGQVCGAGLDLFLQGDNGRRYLQHGTDVVACLSFSPGTDCADDDWIQTMTRSYLASACSSPSMSEEIKRICDEAETNVVEDEADIVEDDAVTVDIGPHLVTSCGLADMVSAGDAMKTFTNITGIPHPRISGTSIGEYFGFESYYM